MKRIAVLLIMSTVFFSGCASTKGVLTTVEKQYEFVVSLEQHQEKGLNALKEYNQPYEISLGDIEKLKNIRDTHYGEVDRRHNFLCASVVLCRQHLSADSEEAIRVVSECLGVPVWLFNQTTG